MNSQDILELANRNLLRVQQNDSALKELYLGDQVGAPFDDGGDTAAYNHDFTAIGTAIGNNTNLERLVTVKMVVDSTFSVMKKKLMCSLML